MMRPGSGAVRSLTDRVGKAQPSAGYVPRLTPPSQTATASVSSRPAPQGGAGWSTQDWAERRSTGRLPPRRKSSRSQISYGWRRLLLLVDDQVAISHWIVRDGEFEHAVEDQPPAPGSAPVEAEHELVEVAPVSY